MSDLFSYADTRSLARSGMLRAIEHADRVEPTWSDRATAILHQFAMTNHEFMAEDVRVHAHKVMGLPNPPDPRSWGAVINAAVRQGVIVRDRYELTKIPPAHATPRPVWKSRIFRVAA